MKDFGYATDNAGWVHSDRAVLLWSPDGRMIATQQQDQRGDGEMYLVTTPTGGTLQHAGGHPELKAWKYPLPGDSVVTTIQRVDHQRARPARWSAADAARPAPVDAGRHIACPA